MQDKSIKDEFISLRKKLMELDFSHLNEKQREAVFCTEGPAFNSRRRGERENHGAD